MKIEHKFSNCKHGVGYWTTDRIKSYSASGKRVLDIGCGDRKIPGSIGIDSCSRKADISMEIRDTLPFKDNSFDEVFCLNYLEHTFYFNHIIDEMYRVLKPGGIAHVEVPYYNSFNYGQVPFHKVPFAETTMASFFSEGGEFVRYSKSRFKIKKQVLYFTKPSRILPKFARMKMIHYIGNLAYQIYWKLEK